MDDLLSRHPVTAVSIYIPIPTDGIARILIRSFFNNLRVLRDTHKRRCQANLRYCRKASVSALYCLRFCTYPCAGGWTVLSGRTITLPLTLSGFAVFAFWLVANCRMPYHRSYSRFNVLSCDSDYCPPLAALNTAPSSLYGLAGEVQFQHLIPLFFILYNYYRLSSWVCQELFDLNKSRRQRQRNLYWCR